LTYHFDMNSQQFVDALKRLAADSGAEGVLSQWEAPSGRSPGLVALERAKWFNDLSENDRKMVNALAYDAAHATLFGVLCILDGVRRIDPSDEAHFELVRIEQGLAQVLASSSLDAEILHDLL